ncbi:MAG: nucleoside hydrolase [Hyphomicrobiaceae bacterium]
MAIKILIDTDPGIDDALAIAYALADTELHLVGLTTIFGNVSVDQATHNALALLSHLGQNHVPVARGATRPLVQTPLPHPDFVHGADGFGGAELPQSVNTAHSREAADFIIDVLRDSPGEIVVVALGPLTNIAEALRRDPMIADFVKLLVVMGGAYQRSGNATRHAEANIWQDPHAADLVFKSNCPLHLVGLNVTEMVLCTREDFDLLASRKPKSGAFLRKAVEFYMNFHKESAGIDGCFLHDPSAVIAAVEPRLFNFHEIPIMVACSGVQTGSTVAATDGRSTIKVGLSVDQEALKRRFLEVICDGPLP